MSFTKFCEANELASYLVEHEIDSEVFCNTFIDTLAEHGKYDEKVINEFLGRLGLGGISNLARGAAYLGGAAGAPAGAAARGLWNAGKAGANAVGSGINAGMAAGGRAVNALGQAVDSGVNMAQNAAAGAAKAVGGAAQAGVNAAGKGLDAMNQAGKAAAVREDLKQARVNVTQLAQQIQRIGLPANVMSQLMMALQAKEQEMGLGGASSVPVSRPAPIDATRGAAPGNYSGGRSGKPDFSFLK